MTNKHYQQWLADPQLALADLLKDLEYDPPFDSNTIEDALIEATGYSKDGKPELTINKEVATWAYQTDNEELFTEALAWNFADYDNFLIPVYECVVNTYDEQFDKATLHISRTQNKLVTIIQTDWTLPSGREYKIDFYNPDDLDLEMEVDSFITMVEDYAAYNSGCKLITDDIEEYEAEGRIAGSVSYESYMEEIEAKEKHYILN